MERKTKNSIKLHVWKSVSTPKPNWKDQRPTKQQKKGTQNQHQMAKQMK